MKSHHNTTNEKGSELATFEKIASTQEDTIKSIFEKSPTGFTASEVLKVFPSDNVPITSIRRGLTNLCDQDKLYKSESMRVGMFGRKEHVYVKCVEVVDLTGK